MRRQEIRPSLARYPAIDAQHVSHVGGLETTDRVRHRWRQYLRFAVRHPKEYQVLFLGQLPVDVPNPRDAAGYTPTFRFLIDRVDDCVRAGLMPAGTNVFEVAMLSWSVGHGLAALYLNGRTKCCLSPAQFRRLGDRVMERTVDGLLR